MKNTLNDFEKVFAILTTFMFATMVLLFVVMEVRGL